MAEHQYISQLFESQKIDAVYVVVQAEKRESKNGPWTSLIIQDKTGQINAKIWRDIEFNLPSGTFIHLLGYVKSYNEKLEITVSNIVMLTEEEKQQIDFSDYIASSARAPEDMLEEVEQLSEEILLYAPWKKFVFSVFHDEKIRKKLLTASAARKMHHAYSGGLLEHSISVAKLCMHICDHYPVLDRQLLFVAALLHDIGKIEEMEGLLVTEYTTEGKLLGHLLQGILLLTPFLEKSDLEENLKLHFKHLLASHHGTKEFNTIKLPQTAEAYVLHRADDLDARIAQIGSFFDDIPANNSEECWSPWTASEPHSHCRMIPTPTVINVEKETNKCSGNKCKSKKQKEKNQLPLF